MGNPGRIALSLTVLLSAASAFAQTSKIMNKEPEAVPGEFLARPKSKSLLEGLNREVLEIAVQGQVARVHANEGIVVIRKPVIQTMDSALADIRASGAFEVVEPNYIYRVKKAPNDPSYGLLWGLTNKGQADSDKQLGVVGVDVDAEKAWEIHTGSQDMIVGVVDTGISTNHPDLIDNLWVNEAEKNGQAGVDDDKNGIIDDVYGADFSDASKPTGNPLDDHGHGSHCAGSIGAKGDDGKGIVGVNWNVRMMGIKFLSADGSGSLEGAILGINYGTKMGAKVLSNSWGGGGFSQLLKDAIEEAHKAGVLFIAAAANDGSNNDDTPVYPANYDVPNVVSVAALDNRGNLAGFSNYGKKTVHIAAPGVNIYSSIKGTGYDSWSGTSMATPHVSGVAALLWSHVPTLTHMEVKDRLLKSVRPLASMRNRVSTGGIVNAYFALSGDAPPEDPNDPQKWAKVSNNTSSPHPYKKGMTYEFEFEVAGAQKMALYFEKFETESGYDLVTFYTRDGKVAGVMSGRQHESYSPVIEGDYVRVVLKTDDSVEKYGFDVTEIAYQ